MKRILIIGATSSIAGACARKWARQGASFFLVARNPERLKQTSQDLLLQGASSADCMVMDAGDLDAHDQMLQQALERLGQIDVCLIAYGTLPNQKTCEASTSAAVEAFTNNATTTIALLTLVANQLEIQHCGSIAVITSVAGDRGRPSNYLYGSAKAAISTFCEGLHVRLHKVGAHLIDIRPGFVDTPMTRGLSLPQALLATPEDVATRIVKGIERKQAVLYTPAFWALIMLIIRWIPRSIFKRLKL